MKVDGVEVPFTSRSDDSEMAQRAAGFGTYYKCSLCDYEFLEAWDPHLLMHSSYAQQGFETNDKIRRHLEFVHPDWRERMKHADEPSE